MSKAYSASGPGNTTNSDRQQNLKDELEDDLGPVYCSEEWHLTDTEKKAEIGDIPLDDMSHIHSLYMLPMLWVGCSTTTYKDWEIQVYYYQCILCGHEDSHKTKTCIRDPWSSSDNDY